MQNKHSIFITIILSIFLISQDSFSQDYTQDSLAVRAILDSNGLDSILVEAVSLVKDNRIFVLQLGGYGLTSLPPVIDAITNLEEINLELNFLTNLPKEIGNLNKLHYLNLARNDFSYLLNEIGNLKNLRFLKLTNNKLTTLPQQIGNNISLEELYVENNQLSSLPSEIGNLSSLIIFDLSYNQLTNIPPEIGKLDSLKKLHISENLLTTIPKEIGDQKMLEVLTLWRNNLTHIPQEIGDLASLNELHLPNNKLSTLPDSIVKLNLIALDVDSNRLNPESLSVELIEWLDNLDPGWKETQDISGIISGDKNKYKGLSLFLNSKSNIVNLNIPCFTKLKLELFDLKGKLLITLINNEYFYPGHHKIFLPVHKQVSGLYILKLTLNNNQLVITKKNSTFK